jgi:integrase
MADPFLFSSSKGRPIRWRNLRRRRFKVAVESSVGSRCVPHDLRDTHAALCIAQNIHPKVLQARLGHTPISMTMDRYGGLFPGHDEGIADAFDGLFQMSRVSDSCRVPADDLVALAR